MKWSAWIKTGVTLGTLGLFVLPKAPAVPVQITYTDGDGEGFNESFWGPQRRFCFEAAVSNWANRLGGAVPIDITAAFDPMGGDAVSAVLGMAGPRAYNKDFPNAPLAATWYPGALANQLAGVDLDPEKPDLSIRFNTDVDNPTVLGARRFFYGTTGKPGTNVDFYAVALHELGHGLGFLSTFSSSGAYEISGLPYVFDTMLTAGALPGSPMLSSLDNGSRASALTGNALYFSGPYTQAAAQGAPARLFAPSPYQPGSSTSHLDESSYTVPNDLMTPYLSGTPHIPGPVAEGIYRDLGWSFMPYTVGEAGDALRIVSGLVKGTESQFVRLNVVDAGWTWSRVDMADVTRILRQAAGLDANP